MKELSVSSANYYRLMTSCLQEPFKKLTQNITFWLDESSRSGYNAPVLGIRRKTDSWVQKGPFHRVVGLPVVFGSRGDFLQGHALYFIRRTSGIFYCTKTDFFEKKSLFSRIRVVAGGFCTEPDGVFYHVVGTVCGGVQAGDEHLDVVERTVGAGHIGVVTESKLGVYAAHVSDHQAVYFFRPLFISERRQV